VRIPLRDHILGGVVQGEHRYSMRVVRTDGITECLCEGGAATFFYEQRRKIWR
jgi:hypothetical protein